MEKNPQTLYLWRAPLRPYKKRSGLILRFYLSVALLLSLIIFFFGDKILLIPIFAILFLFYVLTITPPPEVENKITRFGIESAGVTLRWEVLSHFYFSQRFGFSVLTIVSRAPYLLHTYLVVPDNQVKKIVIDHLSQYLVYQEAPQKNITDKMVDFLFKLIPDEKEKQADSPTASSATRSASPLPQKFSPNG